jgi:hypothetical protein
MFENSSVHGSPDGAVDAAVQFGKRKSGCNPAASRDIAA